MNLWPPKFLLLQRVHPGDRVNTTVAGAGSPRAGPVDREACVAVPGASEMLWGPASAMLNEAINWLSWAGT